MGRDDENNRGEEVDEIAPIEPIPPPIPAAHSPASVTPTAPNKPVVSRSVDLERREDRFIIFVRDTGELIDALGAHTRCLDFPETPVTRTVYFGDSARGLPPGLSIKARTYERDRLPGRWDLRNDSMFELLELKRTVEVDRVKSAARSAAPTKKKKKKKRDELVEILRLSASILSRTTYKAKQRKPHLSLDELLELIGDPPSVRDHIDPELYIHLLETVHPLRDFRWRPVIGTEYKRTHFVTREPELSDVFRATLDKRVTHYTFYQDDPGSYTGIPIATEGFSRFEVKADSDKLSGTALGEWLDEMVVNFRAFRIPSKKYRGMTVRSDYHVRRQAFRDEYPGQTVFAEFRSTPVRYRDHEHYVNLARYIQSSKSFHLYEDTPILLESHEHSVRGRTKGLRVLITGNHLRSERAPLELQAKPVAIFARDAVPVTDLPLTSRDDLDQHLSDAKFKDRSTQYDRSRGFLVENRQTGRVYKVALERRHRGGGSPEYYVVISYVGRSRGRPSFATKQVLKDVTTLYRFLRKDPLLSSAG